ncbi:MAG TPA: mismatch-specific DNA-glycosylase, partial [Acidimicrobiales bacterium]|nr:mismatch-specific DNA-glycosylase [Acidimicrobiales bacterium]
RPGNRFWKALAGAGLTDRVLDPSEQSLLPSFGIGITNLVPRPTASAAELGADELRRGADRLASKIAALGVGTVAVLGVGAYRTAFGRPKATIGPQGEALGGAPVWVLANPSGLQARYQLPDLVAMFAEVGRAAFATAGGAGRAGAGRAWSAAPSPDPA